MPTHKTKRALLKSGILALFFGAAGLSMPAMAQSPEHPATVHAGDLTLKGAFIRATLPRSPTGAAYVTITNDGSTDDRLMSVTTPVGDRAVLHEMVEENDIMPMRTLSDGLSIPVGETVSLVPGVTHIMIYGLDAPLVMGQTIDLSLTFETAGDVIVSFDVLKLNALSHPDMDTEGQRGN
ncbi:copper chaperone PCu(A)C [Sedimentitalea sp.]|uniref:copper chaperone PCu(A)C n=1 Tax=Sedimentitalea sp. TaxID=2048915 RepID=UPI0032986F20